MHDVISEREEEEEQRRSARHTNAVDEKSRGMLLKRMENAGKRNDERSAREGVAARKRGDFTSGRRMKRSWFVSA